MLFYYYFDSKVLFDLWNSFLFKNHFTKNNTLCNDPQLFCRFKYFFVTITMAFKLPQPTLSSIILSCVCFFIHFDEDGNEIFIYSLVRFSISVYFIFDKGGFDYQHMTFILVIVILMISDEHKENASFGWIQIWRIVLMVDKWW